MARLNPLDEDALLLDAQRRNRERLGIHGSVGQPKGIGNLLGEKVLAIAPQSPARSRQRSIDFDEGKKLVARLQSCRSAALVNLVYRLLRTGDAGVTENLDEIALRSELSLSGMRKVLRSGEVDGFLEIIPTGPHTPRRIRLVPALREALSGCYSSDTPTASVSVTRVTPSKPLTSTPNPASINNSPNGTPGASRARHDADQTCNGIISRSATAARRLSTRARRELLADARIRADVVNGIALLAQAGIDRKEAERLALHHESIQIGAAIARCRIEQAKGKKFAKGFTAYVHGAVSRSFVRPEVREHLLARGAGDAPPVTS